MSRLPTPGSDDNTWGDILNDYLGVTLNTDGTIKTGVVTSANILDATITTTDISATAGITKAQLASSVQTSLSAADAAAPDSSVVHLAGTETVTGTKTFSAPLNATNSVVTPKVTSSGNAVMIQQTGDQYGATSFQLLNRNNFNGMYVQVAGNDLADLILSGSSGVSSNVRFEHRGTGIADPNNTAGEFQLGAPGGGQGVGSWLNAGPVSTIVKANLGVGLGTNASPNSTLQVAGSVAFPYAAKTAAYTVTNKDYVIDCTSNSFTVTLPTAAGVTGRQYAVKNSGTGSITIATTSSQTIDGASTYVLSAQYQGVILESNGSNWQVLAGTGATVTDATTTSKGVIQLAGDLGGTAAAPTTPTAVHITGTETVAGAKTFTSSVTVSGASQGLIVSNTASSQYSNAILRLINSVSTMTGAAGFNIGAVVSDTSGAVTNLTFDSIDKNGSYLNTPFSIDLTSFQVNLKGALQMGNNNIINLKDPVAAQDGATKAYVDSTAAAGTPDATTTAKGKIQLAGDLGGTAAAPTVPTKLSLTGGTMTGGLTVPNVNAIKSQVPSDIYQWFYSDATATNQVPFGEIWHDLLAFNKLYTVTSDTTTNGSTWTSATVNKKIFAHLENQSVQILNGTIQGIRWTFSNMAYATGRWLMIAYTYIANQPNVTLYVQSSSDGSTWTNRHNSSYTPGVGPVWHYVQDNGGDAYVRIMIQAAAALTISSIRFYSARWGDQGAGKEIEQPYTWNELGYIGIGKGMAAPGYPLDVTGDANITGQLNLVSGANVSNYGGGTFISLPTTGPSGIGMTDGNGKHAWLGYSSANGTWFNTAVTGDINFRSGSSNSLNLGTEASTTPIATISSSGMALNANKIVNLKDPTAAQDAATKNYVDSTAVTQTQLNSYTVDTTNIGIPFVGTNGITVTETSSAITIGYSGASGGTGGGIARVISQVTAATTAGAVASTDYVYWWSGATAYVLTLPTAVSNTNRYTLKNSGSVSQLVATTSSQTIDGSTSITVSAGNSVDLISNGSNWMVI